MVPGARTAARLRRLARAIRSSGRTVGRHRMTDHKDRIAHTLEVLVYAPIGAGLYLRDMGPTFVNMFVARGRAEIDRRQAQVQQRTTTARSIGQVATAFGVPMVRQRVEREVDTARQRAQTLLGSIAGSDGTNGAPAARAEPARA